MEGSLEAVMEKGEKKGVEAAGKEAKRAVVSQLRIFQTNPNLGQDYREHPKEGGHSPKSDLRRGLEQAR